MDEIDLFSNVVYKMLGNNSTIVHSLFYDVLGQDWKDVVVVGPSMATENRGGESPQRMEGLLY